MVFGVLLEKGKQEEAQDGDDPIYPPLLTNTHDSHSSQSSLSL